MCAHNVKILLMAVHHISLSINYHSQVGDEATEAFLEEADASTAISKIPHFTTSQFLESVAHLYGPKDNSVILERLCEQSAYMDCGTIKL